MTMFNRKYPTSRETEFAIIDADVPHRDVEAVDINRVVSRRGYGTRWLEVYSTVAIVYADGHCDFGDTPLLFAQYASAEAPHASIEQAERVLQYLRDFRDVQKWRWRAWCLKGGA